MNEFGATIYLAALFVLRCVAPLLLTLGLGYLMNQLLDRWETEEAGRQVTAPIFTTTEQAPAASATPSVLSLPCWLLNNCDEAQRARCAAYKRQGIPCWQARLIEEGKLPDSCPTCPRYIAAQAAA